MIWLAVLSDDEPGPTNHLDPVDQEFVPDGMRTPPAPPSQSPPPASPLSWRVPAVAQLRPVSISSVVRVMAGKNIEKQLADFNRHYMPDGVPEIDVSVTGNIGQHRYDLKRKANGTARSLA